MKKTASLDKMEALRQENAIKTMYYTRYFVVRYAVAFYFFANLYWALLLYLAEIYLPMVLPLTLLALGGLAMWEQFQMFTRDQKEARKTKLFFKATLFSNSLLLLLTALSSHQIFYPFMNGSLKARLVLAVFLAIGLGLAYGMLKKMSVIDSNKDRQHKRISRYLMSLKP